MASIERDIEAVLSVLAEEEVDVFGVREGIGGTTLQEATGLEPGRLNDAVTLLVESGLAEWDVWSGTAPFVFGSVSITARGVYELEQSQKASGGVESAAGAMASLPPTPIGSPYGFTDVDWETVSECRARPTHLYVVLGYQFRSEYYDPDRLRENIQGMFERSVATYNGMVVTDPVELHFRPLAAGYGEHLFNEIARDIISADIAVFETSDLNPNVMVELGVALTWGVRVLPIKERTRPVPPSDISGQTWADYLVDASQFLDPEHDQKLVRMVERAVRKKGR